MTRAVVFDVDGVLIHGYHARPDQRESWDKALAAVGVDADRFQSEFIFDVFMKKVLIGQTPMMEALDKRLSGMGYKGSTMAFADLWLNHDATLNLELVETIKRLKAHPDVRLFIATNQDHMRAQWLWTTMGLGALFEDIFYSARAGMTKAHRGFFEFADDRMGRFDEPPLFFDDTQKVLDVAKSHGWETVLFTGNDDVLSHSWIAERLR